MKYDPRIHHRRSMRLKKYDYSQAGFYFITICTQNRLHLFGEIVNGEMILNCAGKMIKSQWMELSKRFADIQLYQNIIMPNHFHGIVRRGEPCVRPNQTIEQRQMGEHKVRPYGTLDGTIGRMVQAFKSITTNEYISGVKQNGWQRFDKKLWQRSYWEHIIRDENEFNHISQYIIENPIRWGNDKFNN